MFSASNGKCNICGSNLPHQKIKCEICDLKYDDCEDWSGSAHSVETCRNGLHKQNQLLKQIYI